MELTISLGPFLVDFPEKISLNIIKDKIEVNPVVLGNTNANFYGFFQYCCQVTYIVLEKVHKPWLYMFHCGVDYFCLDPTAY